MILMFCHTTVLICRKQMTLSKQGPERYANGAIRWCIVDLDPDGRSDMLYLSIVRFGMDKM